MPHSPEVAFSRADPAFRELQAIVAERTTPVVFWVGAGMSVAAGVPTWSGLREELVQVGTEKARTLDDDSKAAMLGQLSDITTDTDLWVSFERLKVVLGPETFQRSIRKAVNPASTAEIPEAYKILWELDLRGVLTLNIDRLAYRAFSAMHAGDLVSEFDGREIARLRQLLFGRNKFVGNLHGNFEDATSWVFTRSEIRKLLQDDSYTEFLRMVLSSCVNVFLGMSVDDIAVGGQLSKLMEQRVFGQPRFWFCDRSDIELDRWAEDRGVRVIRYRPSPSHEAALCDFLVLLRDALPGVDPTPPPISPLLPLPDAVFQGEVLVDLSGDDLRRALNARAAEILAHATPEAYERYNEFCQTYDEEIHRAWFVAPRPGKNQLLGYTLTEKVARGAFGQVYRAVAPDGQEVAVKLLLQDVHEDADLLRSFRQGVASMRILQKYAISSMVAYKVAYEIPAFVVMDWVDGPNLTELYNARQVRGNWKLLLKVGNDLAEVIRRAHSLPERILHRDIRPANIMLRDYWTQPDAWELVVLDFDLSWHRGLEQKSVYFSSALGYLAPEQIDQRSESTRNAAVDSFGVGMTLYFLLVGRDPLPDQHRHRDFSSDVAAASRAFGSSVDWLSLPARFARLVVAATADSQADRLDMSEIASELAILQRCLATELDNLPSGVVAEELAARMGNFRDYSISDFGEVHSSGIGGVRFSLIPDEPSGRIRIRVAWSRTGQEQRANLGKYVQQGANRASAGLAAAGWRVERNESSGQSLELTASVASGVVSRELRSISRRTEEALATLNFGK